MKCEVTITGPPFITGQFFQEFQENPPKDKHGHPPDKWDASISVDPPVELFNRDDSYLYAEPRESTATITITYPDPKPDIPALIRSWHAEPTKANKAKVWQAIRDRATLDTTMGNMAIGSDGLAYIAEKNGNLMIQ